MKGFFEQMVCSDGDELCNSICYGFQIGGNIICSVILARFLGMTGLMEAHREKACLVTTGYTVAGT